MWYGNLREAPVTANPTFDFVAAVSDQTAPEKKTKKSPKKSLERLQGEGLRAAPSLPFFLSLSWDQWEK